MKSLQYLGAWLVLGFLVIIFCGKMGMPIILAVLVWPIILVLGILSGVINGILFIAGILLVIFAILFFTRYLDTFKQEL